MQFALLLHAVNPQQRTITTIHHCFLGNLIDARHVVDGHREKTLALLWQIIFHFQVSCGPCDSSLLRYQSFVKC